MKFFTKINFQEKSLKELIKQFVKFGVVGLSNTIISLTFYYGLIYIGVNYVIANAIGFIISVLNAYYWSNKYVFKKTNKGNLRPMLKTFAAYGLTFTVSTILLIAMVDYIHISTVIAPLLNLIITIPINFMLNKFWAFK